MLVALFNGGSKLAICKETNFWIPFPLRTLGRLMGLQVHHDNFIGAECGESLRREISDKLEALVQTHTPDEIFKSIPRHLPPHRYPVGCRECRSFGIGATNRIMQRKILLMQNFQPLYLHVRSSNRSCVSFTPGVKYLKPVRACVFFWNQHFRLGARAVCKLRQIQPCLN